MYAHPKLCMTYLREGDSKINPEKGFNKGDCGLYHPPLCYHSIKLRACCDKACMRRHLPKSKLKKGNTKSNPQVKNQGPRSQGAYKNARFSRDPGYTQRKCCHLSQAIDGQDTNAQGHLPQPTHANVQGQGPSQDPFLGQSTSHLEQMVKRLMAECLGKLGVGHPHPGIVPSAF